jgi:glucokinase
MDESTLAKDLNLKSVHLMSDLEAVALCCAYLQAEVLLTINTRRAGCAWHHRDHHYVG